MSTIIPQQMRTTGWLAKRLGLSIATIERLRAQKSTDLPPHIAIGKSIRYDELAVEAWLRERFHCVATPINAVATDGGSGHE